MEKGTIFFAGVYGVGKSTICMKLSVACNITAYSASDLISDVNEEHYGKSKFVSNLDNNQAILRKRVEEILESEQTIILSGHFCILDKDNRIISIPDEIFHGLGISKIILLEADVNVIQINLSSRDGVLYSNDKLYELIEKERAKATLFADELKVPLLIYKMNYTEGDIKHIRDFINKGGNYESIT